MGGKGQIAQLIRLGVRLEVDQFFAMAVTDLTFSPLRGFRRVINPAVVSTILLLAFGVFLVGCGGGDEAEPTDVGEPTPVSESSPESTEPAATSAISTPVPALDEPEPAAESEDEVDDKVQLLYRITRNRVGEPGSGDAVAAAREIGESGDLSFVVGLSDLIQVPLTRDELLFNANVILPVMQQLSGQDLAYDGKAWVEWVAKQPDLMLPEGYFGWKVDLLSQIDPRFRNYFTVDGSEGLMDPADIDLDLRFMVWGGVFQDDGTARSIPSLVEPAMVEAEEAVYLRDDDRVFGVSINGDSRAYPLRIMNWHEMANDVVGGVPVALAYCTLCGSGVLYETQLEDETYVFRSSGLLYFSNKLMYDLTTGGLWNQFTGVPVTGSLAGSGLELNVRPVTLTTWGDWLASHPDTLAMDINTGFPRNYSSEGVPGSAYVDYFSSPELWFPVNVYDERLQVKDVVYGIEIEGEAKAYPVDIIGEEVLVNDEVGGTNLVLLGNPGTKAVKVFERGDLEFTGLLTEHGTTTLTDSHGMEWQVTDSQLESKNGSGALARVGGRTSFWFGWRAFFPETELYGGGG